MLTEIIKLITLCFGNTFYDIFYLEYKKYKCVSYVIYLNIKAKKVYKNRMYNATHPLILHN